MFCINCGKQCVGEAALCSACGLKVVNAELSQRSGLPGKQQLDFGSATRTWSFFHSPIAELPIPSEYQWLKQQQTVICQNHIVFLPNGKYDGRSEAIKETVARIGGVFGLLGALTTGLAVGAVDAVQAKLKLNDINQVLARADSEFSSNRLLWCRRADSELWRYHEKAKSASELLYLPMISKQGVIPVGIVVWYSVLNGRKGRPDFAASFGCKVVDKGFDMTDEESFMAMHSRFLV